MPLLEHKAEVLLPLQRILPLPFPHRLLQPPRHAERTDADGDQGPQGFVNLFGPDPADAGSRRSCGHFIGIAGPEAERINIVADFAVPFIFAGLERIMGIPLEDHAWMKRLTAGLATGLDFRKEEETVAANQSCGVMIDFVESLVARGPCSEGLLAVLIECRDRQLLDHEDLIANIVFLLFAGQETIVDMIGNSVVALDRNPEQAQRVRSDVGDLNRAADELIRYDPSVQFSGARIAARDLHFEGLFVAAGDSVVCVLGAGNRDPSLCDDSETLDVARSPPSASLGFGWGPHICIGRNIARLELRIALETLYRVLPPWRLDAGASTRRQAVNWRGMASAPAQIS